MDVFCNYFNVNDNQFGFKRGVGCSHAINSVKRVIDYYVSGNGTASLCAIDIRKAYDSVDHTGLFLKLMDRRVPVYVFCSYSRHGYQTVTHVLSGLSNFPPSSV